MNIIISIGSCGVIINNKNAHIDIYFKMVIAAPVIMWENGIV